MKITLKEVHTDEGAWVEGDGVTYLIAYEQEVRQLAVAFGIDVDQNEEILLDLLKERVGESAELPETIERVRFYATWDDTDEEGRQVLYPYLKDICKLWLDSREEG